MRPPSWLLPHTVTVEPYLGASAYGDRYGPPVEVRCRRDEKRRLIRDSHGEQVVSEATLWCVHDDEPRIPVDSRVTLRPGHTTLVLAVSRHDDAGLGAWETLEVSLA